MATPRVFISSTCYDLKHIRENLKYFVKTLGYDPVLSEEGDVYYSPSSHTHDACLKEVSTCQIFVLIIGGKFGGSFKETDSSITNNEYRKAVKCDIPIFALVELAVYSDHHLYQTNQKENPNFFNKITYPSCDNIQIFNFIDEVRKQTENNALFPFTDFNDIECYLKKQWAGMMYDFLDQRSDESKSKITNKLLDDLSLATRKSEELIKVLLKSTTKDTADEEIQKVSTKIEAQNFIREVRSKFGVKKLHNADLEKLLREDLPESYDEFLLSMGDFFTDTHEDENGDEVLVLWGPENRGIAIGHYEGSDFIKKPEPELEKTYEALKKVDPKTKENIISELIEF